MYNLAGPEHWLSVVERRLRILYNYTARDATQQAAQSIWARQKALELNSKHAYRQFQDTAHRTAVRRVSCDVLGGVALPHSYAA